MKTPGLSRSENRSPRIQHDPVLIRAIEDNKARAFTAWEKLAALKRELGDSFLLSSDAAAMGVWL